MNFLVAFIFFLIPISFLLPATGIGIQADTVLKKYSLEQGLTQSSVFTIEQDNLGRMWFGTSDGLNSYDGHSFKVIKNSDSAFSNLRSNSIISIKKDFWGNLWIGTENGLYNFSIKNNTLTEVKIPHFPENTIYWALFIDSKKQIWCATDNGVVRFSHEEYYRNKNSFAYKVDTSYKVTNLSHFQELSNGDINIFFDSNVLYSQDFKKKSLPPILTKHLSDSQLSWIYEIKKDHFLVRHNNGVFIINVISGKRQMCQFPFKTPKAKKSLVAVATSNEGITYLSFYGQGVFKFDENSFQFIPIKNESGNVSLFCPELFISKDNSLWMGSAGGEGVLQYFVRKLKFPKYNSESITGFPMTDMMKFIFPLSDSTMLFGFFNLGLFSYSPGEKTGYRIPLAAETLTLRFGILCGVKETEKSLILGGPLGVYRYFTETKTSKLLYINTVEERVTEAVTVLPNGNILATTRIGLREITPAGRLIQSDLLAKVAPLIQGGISQLVRLEQKLYIGTISKGLIIYDFKNKSIDTITWKKIIASFPGVNTHVKTIVRSKRNHIWIGTQNGIVIIDQWSNPISYLTEKSGLKNGFIYGMLEDNIGRIWVSTNKGLSLINSDLSVQNFRMSDGLQALEYNTGAFGKTPNGTMLFGGISGFNIFHPDSILNTRPEYSIIISEYSINGETKNKNLPLSAPNTLLLDYTQNNLQFEVSALDLLEQEGLYYSFLLEGLESDWQYSGNINRIRYTSLTAGTYILKCRASVPGGLWSHEVVLMTITIRPPFWQNFWFIFSAVILLVLIAAQSARHIAERKYKATMKKMEDEQMLHKERERIARDMHDEVGASLTKLAMQSRILMNKNASPEIHSLESEITDTIQKLDEIVWTINPKNDTLGNVLSYISEYTEEFFSTSEISYRFKFQSGISELPLRAEQRQHILLIVKEALNNIIKYANCTIIVISVSIREGFLHLTISDDGCGIPSEPTSLFGNGLKNMNSRAEFLGGTLSINSSPSTGTTLVIAFPITVSHKNAIDNDVPNI